MKTIRIKVADREGLHLRPATRLVRFLQRFKSQVFFRAGAKLLDGKSLLCVLLLAAAPNAVLEVEVNGEDEDAAVQAIEEYFGGHIADTDW